MLLLSLLGGTVVATANSQSSRDEEKKFWQLMVALEQKLPFRRDDIEETTGVALVPDEQLPGSFQGSSESKGGNASGIEIRQVFLKVANEDPLKHALLTLDTSPICISPAVLRQHYGSEGQLNVLSIHGPPGIVLIFKRTWGEAAFEYQDDCIHSIVLTPTQFIKHAK